MEKSRRERVFEGEERRGEEKKGVGKSEKELVFEGEKRRGGKCLKSTRGQ